MKRNLLIITQVLDEADSNLGFFCRWVTEYASQVDQLYVIALRVGTYHAPSNVTVLSLGKEEGNSRIKRLCLFWKYCLVYGRKATAVFAHMCPEYILYGAWLLRSKRRKLGLWYLHKSVTLKLKLAEKMVDYIFTAHSDGVKAHSKKIVVTGHGIDLDLFSLPRTAHTSSDSIRLLTVGRITPSKDLLLLLRVVKMLHSSNQGKFTLDIVGDAYLPSDHAYLKLLHEEVRKLEINDSVRFVGKTPYTELPKIYRNADIFVSASKTGGIDKAILEAMASACAVITSNEAFRSILPAECIFEEGSVEDGASKIKNYKSIDREKLHEYVIHEHSLEKSAASVLAQLF